MPKLKPHKGLKKRVKVTATGKVLRGRCGRRHLLSHKSGKQVRQMRRKSQISRPELAKVKTLMGER